MLLTLCKKCGKFLNEGESLYQVLVDEGAGIITPMEVCCRCYEQIEAPELLLENQ